MSSFVEAWDTPAHIFKALSVSLFVWHELDLAAAAGKLDRPVGKLFYRCLVAVSKIDHLANTRRSLKQFDQALHDVVHMSEAASLSTVPVDLDRLLTDGCMNKARYDHAVLTR